MITGRRGNRNWGKLLPPAPSVLTEFEMQVARLGLKRSEYSASVALRRWCERNHSRVYVPEWLLDEWGMHVETSFGRAV
jgi:hypothetical protein